MSDAASIEDYKRQLAEYRAQLLSAVQKAQEGYDKTVLALSGGAFGISFAFVDNFIVEKVPMSPGWLLAAWMAWGTSITAVLFSFYFSNKALRRAIGQIDAGEYRAGRLGGRYTLVTEALNIAGGALFLVGALLLVVFVHQNI